jgi:hypothetical protein
MKRPKLHIVAGTDVAAPPLASIPPDDDDPIYELLEPLFDLFEHHKQAQINYRRAVAEVARRTGRSIRSVGTTLAAETHRRQRVQRFEPEEWFNLM